MANQTGIVGNPYAGGNVAFNTTPFTQFYINSLARQQAKDEAFAKSFQEQAKALTPTGMRGQDVNALIDAKNKWESDWYKNKDLIQHPNKDNGAAWAANNELYNHANTIPTVSKDRAKMSDNLNKIRLDPEKSKYLTDDAMHLIDAHNLPINDPNHRPLTEGDFGRLYRDKPLDATKLFALQNTLKSNFPGEELSTVQGETDPNTYKRKDIVNYGVNKSHLQPYLELGRSLYSNGDLKGEIDPIVNSHVHGMNNPMYDELNKTFKANYGKDIEHPEEAAAAWLINKNTNYGEKPKETLDVAAQKAAADALWLKHNKITSGQADERARKSRELREKLADVGSDVIPQIFNGYKTGVPFEGDEGKNVEQLKIPPIIAQKFKDKNGNIPAFGLGQDGKIYSVQFQKEPIYDKENKQVGTKETKKPDWSKTVEIPQSEMITEIQNHAVPTNSKAKTMLKTLGQRLGIGNKQVIVKKGVLD